MPPFPRVTYEQLVQLPALNTWWEEDNLLVCYYNHIFAPYQHQCPDMGEKFEAYTFYCAALHLGEYRDLVFNQKDVPPVPLFMPPSHLEEDWHPNTALMNLLESQTRMLMGVETEDDTALSIPRLLIARAVVLLEGHRQAHSLVSKLPELTEFFRNPPPGVPPLSKIHPNDFAGMPALFATLTGLDDLVHNITDEYRLKVDLWRKEILGAEPLFLPPEWSD